MHTELLKISIVTPSYNQGKFLEACIDSILSQNYPNLEYIVMDGGSTDNSVEIIKKYEKHLAYWQSRKDDGHYSAVNEGFKRSSGKIMGWLNSDDMLHPGCLSRLNDIFNKNPGTELITGRRVGFDKDGKRLSYGFEKQTWCRSRLLDPSYIDRELFVMQEGTFWRRTLWERAGGSIDISYDLAADFELWARFSRYARLYTVDALLGGYRYHGETQRSQLHRDEYINQCKEIISRELHVRSQIPDYDDVPPPPISEHMTRSNFEVKVTSPLPAISIVTPSYNQGEFLEECIDSILSQNYPNLEYIVMDGGSTDNSVDIIKKYEKHLTYWQSCPDNGQYAAIHDGLKKTSGEVMAWLNSDDKLHDGSLFTTAYIFSTMKQVQWLTGRPTIWDRNGRLSGMNDILPAYSRAAFLHKQYNAPFIQQESTFWRRSLYEKAGGYIRADLDYAGDLELWVRFFRETELYIVDALLGGYRKYGDQKAGLGMDRYIAEAERVIDEEITLVQSGTALRMQPAPKPLNVLADSIRNYYRTAVDNSNILCNSVESACRHLMPRKAETPSRIASIDTLPTQKTPCQCGEVLVTAIVSVYKAERFIRGCLENLAAQTLFRRGQLEIVVINSGSPENEDAVIREYVDRHPSRIKHIRTEERETIYQAWNRGVQLARGKYLTNANTDDRHREDALEVMANALNANPDSALVYGDSHITVEENLPFRQAFPILSYLWPEFDPRLLFQCCYIGPHPMWRSHLHQKYGLFDPSFRSAGDYEFWLRIAGAGERFMHVCDFLGLYLYSESGMEASNLELSHRESEEARARHWPSVWGERPRSSGNFSVVWPKISVVTPSFNQSRFIEATITSVIAQRYPNMEHIVIDGGSTDGTLDILRRFPHLDWTSEPDSGQSDALNKGLRKATGEIIAWINSDDWYEPGIFEKIAEFFLRNPEKNIVMGDCNLTDEEGKVFNRIINRRRGKTELERHWVQYSIPTQPAVFFRKRLLDDFGCLDESLHYAMDFDLWMRFSEKNIFHHLDATAANYRFHGSAKGGDFNWEKFLPECDLIFKRYSTPVVSVIIPCYNYAAYLPQAVLSVVQQTFRGFEIIIVNDGSTDNTIEVAGQLIAAHPQLSIELVNQKNSGTPAISRNNGIKRARGRFILPLDADDFIDPSYLEKAVAILENEAETAVVYSHIKHEGIRSDIWLCGEFNPVQLAFNNVVPYCALFRKEAWNKVGGYRDDVGYEDWHFWLDLCEAGIKGRLIPEPLFHYRKHAHGRLGQDNAKRERLLSDIVNKHPDIYKGNIRPDGYPSDVSSGHVLIMASHFWPSIGGIEIIVENLALKLMEKGHQVSVATWRLDHNSPQEHRGIKILYFDEGITGQFSACILLADPLSPMIWMMARADISQNTKKIIQPVINREGYERWRNNTHFRKRLSSVLRSMTAVVALTQHGVDATFLREENIPFHFIPNAVETRSATYDFRKKHGIPENATFILHVANLWPVKNHLGLLETLESMEGDWWRLLVIGYPSNTAYATAVGNKAALDNRIIFIPGLPPRDVAAAQDASDVIVLASFGEAAPVSILEAMSCGKPWLATPECGAVHELSGGLVAPLHEFPSLIRLLANDPLYRKQLGEQGHQHWMSAFRWEVVIDAWDSLIRTGSMQERSGAPADVGPGPVPLPGSAVRKPEKITDCSGPPLVSVVMPTRNRPELLARAVESVLAQTYQHVEIIVVNDGGVDVGELIDHFNGRGNIRYFNLKTGIERSAARNLAIRAAKGDYIAYLDDDDRYFPEHLETLVSHARESGCRVVYSDAYRAPTDPVTGKLDEASRDIPYSLDFDPVRIYVENYIPILCLMHERSCLDEAGMFDTRLSRLEDWDLWIRLSQVANFHHIPRATCEFTWHRGGSSQPLDNSPLFLMAYRAICDKHSAMARQNTTIRLWQRHNIYNKTCHTFEYLKQLLFPLFRSHADSSAPHIPPHITASLQERDIGTSRTQSTVFWINAIAENRTETTETWLTRALASDDENHPARLQLAALLMRQNRHRDVIPHLEKIHVYNPVDIPVITMLANLYLHSEHDSHKAAGILNKGLWLFPDNENLRKQLEKIRNR